MYGCTNGSKHNQLSSDCNWQSAKIEAISTICWIWVRFGLVGNRVFKLWRRFFDIICKLLKTLIVESAQSTTCIKINVKWSKNWRVSCCYKVKFIQIEQFLKIKFCLIKSTINKSNTINVIENIKSDERSIQN